MAHIQVYEEKRGVRRRKQYRWRIVAVNNRIIATGAEGYHNLADLWHGVSETARALGAVVDRGTIPIHPRKPKL